MEPQRWGRSMRTSASTENDLVGMRSANSLGNSTCWAPVNSRRFSVSKVAGSERVPAGPDLAVRDLLAMWSDVGIQSKRTPAMAGSGRLPRQTTRTRDRIISDMLQMLLGVMGGLVKNFWDDRAGAG